MRRLVTLLMTLWLVLIPLAVQASTGEVRLVVNGAEVNTDVPPVLEDGQTLVPIRALSEGMGYAVVWDESAQTVTITGDRVIILTVGRREALVDGEARSIDVPPVIRNGRALVPIRFVAEGMGLDVAWDPDSRTVTVSRPAEAAEPEPAEAEPAESISPELQALWDRISAQRDGHVTGTIVTETMWQPELAGIKTETTFESWAQGEEMLNLSRLHLPLAGEVTTGFAIHQGQMWNLSPGEGWIQVEDPAGLLKLRVSGVTEAFPSLEKAQVDLTQAELEGAPMTRLTVTWQNRDMVELAGLDSSFVGEGTTTTTFWLDAEGALKLVEQLVIVGGEGQEIVTRATYTWEPLDGPIPFPAEILN